MRYFKLLITSVFALLIILLSGHKNYAKDCVDDVSFKAKPYTFTKTNYQNLPQGYNSRVIPRDRLKEITRLPTLDYKGQQGYHPVKISRLLMDLLTSYQITGDRGFLKKAEFISSRYINTANELNGAIFFPYTFDFYLHHIKEERMKAPWYSGMAQGTSLSAYVRLYKITSDKEYLMTAHKIFNSFRKLKNHGCNPWVAYVDREGYYWIEEYPMWPAANTLNGFIYGIFGLYEFWLLRQDKASEKTLEAAITTIERYITKFRNPGGISYYCLRHKIRNAKYHKIHINQLEKIYLITGDQYFKEMSKSFRLDYASSSALIRFLGKYIDIIEYMLTH